MVAWSGITDVTQFIELCIFVFPPYPAPSGWPRLVWCLTEHLPKPPKDWTPPQRPQPESDCYAEMTMSKDGSAALGATVTRQGLISHCKVLSTACLYKESECLRCSL